MISGILLSIMISVLPSGQEAVDLALVTAQIEHAIAEGGLDLNTERMAHLTLYQLYAKQGIQSKAGENAFIYLEETKQGLQRISEYAEQNNLTETEEFFKLYKEFKMQAYEAEKILDYTWAMVNPKFGRTFISPIPDASDENVKDVSDFLNICGGEIKSVQKVTQKDRLVVTYKCKDGKKSKMFFLK